MPQAGLLLGPAAQQLGVRPSDAQASKLGVWGAARGGPRRERGQRRSRQPQGRPRRKPAPSAAVCCPPWHARASHAAQRGGADDHERPVLGEAGRDGNGLGGGRRQVQAGVCVTRAAWSCVGAWYMIACMRASRASMCARLERAARQARPSNLQRLAQPHLVCQGTVHTLFLSQTQKHTQRTHQVAHKGRRARHKAHTSQPNLQRLAQAHLVCQQDPALAPLGSTQESGRWVLHR